MSEQTGNRPHFVLSPSGEYILLPVSPRATVSEPESGRGLPLAEHYKEHAGMLIDHPEPLPEAKVLRDKSGRFMKRSLANVALHFSDHPRAV